MSTVKLVEENSAHPIVKRVFVLPQLKMLPSGCA